MENKRIMPIIMDTDFNKLGVVEDYASLIWTTRYYDCGDFEICTYINEKNMKLLKKDYYVIREDDEYVGIIESIELTLNEDLKETMIVKGRFLSSILSRRIIATQTKVNATVKNAIAKLLRANIYDPTITSRKVENFGYYVKGIRNTEKIEAQYTGKNLLETIQEICKEYGIGFKTTFKNKKFTFKLYEGIDRSCSQNDNPYVIFSNEYDNLSSSDYIEEYSNVVTDVLVAGEGEGQERRTLWCTKENKKGLSRYEIYDDNRDISSNDGGISDSEYLTQLKAEGLESITSFTSGFTGQVWFDNIEYKEDLCLGDICTIENTNWNVRINARLIEVIESIDESGSYTITPTFAS